MSSKSAAKGNIRKRRGLWKRLLILIVLVVLFIGRQFLMEGTKEVAAWAIHSAISVIQDASTLLQQPAPTATVVATPNAPTTRAVTPTPRQPLVTISSDSKLVCGEFDYLDIRFKGEAPPQDKAYYPFAIPSGNGRWYPSEEPLSNGEGEYRATIYTGPDHEYRVHVLLVTPKGLQEIKQYLRDREKDNQWAQGMAHQPEDSISRDDSVIVRQCSSSFDRLTPVPVTVVPTDIAKPK